MPAGNLYTPALDSRDIIADFYPRLQAAMENIWATKIGMIVPSDRGTENYAWLGQVPVMRQWTGKRHEEVLAKYAMTIANSKYEATLPISLDDLRRDKTGQLRQRVTDLAARTATHWNSLVVPLINNGSAGTSGLAYDGQFFFDTDHNESGTNQVNAISVTQVPAADVVDTTNVTSVEAANIISQTVGYAMSLTDDKVEPINQDVMAVTILVGKSTHWAAFQNAVSLNNLTQATDNPVRGLNGKGWTFNVIYSPRLAASVKVRFFFGEPTMGAAPFILQNETDVESQLLGAGSDEEFYNDRHVFGVKANRGVGFGMWQRALELTLS